MNFTISIKDWSWMIDFIDESAKYFENRPTEGEDMAYWANQFNADNCRQIRDKLQELYN